MGVAHAGSVTTTVRVGVGPVFIAFDSANGDLYVENLKSSTVSVIDGATNAVVATVDVPSIGNGLAFDSANGDVYVNLVGGVSISANTTTPNKSGVSVIDGTTNKVVATVNTGLFDPQAIGFDSANGDLYVSDESTQNASIIVINGATNQVVGTVPSPGIDPNQFAFDSANGDVYVTNTLANSVEVIDSATNSVVANVTVGAAPGALVYDSQNSDVYVLNSGENATSVLTGATSTISVIDGATNAVVATMNHLSSPGNGLAFDSANGDVYMSNGGDANLSVIDGATNAVAAMVPVSSAESISAIAFDSANGDLYATGESVISTNPTTYAGTVYVIPTTASPTTSASTTPTTTSTSATTSKSSSSSLSPGYVVLVAVDTVLFLALGYYSLTRRSRGRKWKLSNWAI
jgi:YVTN family beta-propeller protein